MLRARERLIHGETARIELEVSDLVSDLVCSFTVHSYLNAKHRWLVPVRFA